MDLQLNASTFKTEISDYDGPAIVDFWAPWCGPCRMMGPVLDSLSGKYEGKVKITKVNVDECPDLAAKYQVSSIPMIAFFKAGVVVHSIVGARQEADLEAEIKKHLL